MSDLIRREDAIDEIRKSIIPHDMACTHYSYLCINAVRRVPSADTDISEYSDRLWKNAYERGKAEEHRWWTEHCAKCTDADRPQGEWIKDNLGIVICSECKRPRRDNRANHINFCNSCGARMKGAEQ